MTTAPTELKPCPFCAGPALPPVYYNGTMSTGCESVECPGDVLVPIAAWNTRAPATIEPQAVDDAMVERMARAHDKEEAAQRGEPSPWDDPTIDAAWIAERITCIRAALHAAKEPSHG